MTTEIKPVAFDEKRFLKSLMNAFAFASILLLIITVIVQYVIFPPTDEELLQKKLDDELRIEKAKYNYNDIVFNACRQLNATSGTYNKLWFEKDTITCIMPTGEVKVIQVQ